MRECYTSIQQPQVVGGKGGSVSEWLGDDCGCRLPRTLAPVADGSLDCCIFFMLYVRAMFVASRFWGGISGGSVGELEHQVRHASWAQLG